MSADGADGAAFSLHVADGVDIVDEDIDFVGTPLWAAQRDAVGFTECEGLLGAHGDKIAFDFGNEAEGKAEDLAVDGVVKTVFFLDGVDIDALLQTNAHYGHDVRQVSAQPRHFRHDERVPLLHLRNRPPELPAVIRFLAADHFHDPFVDLVAVRHRIATDFVALIFRMLLPGAHSNITYNHNFFS